MPLLKSLLLPLFLIIGQFALTAQNDAAYIIDSMYWEKDYDGLIKFGTSALAKGDLDIYNEVGVKYNLAKALGTQGDFPEAYRYIKESYNSISQLDKDDTLQVRLFIDVCQRLGDLSFISEEANLGKAALEKGVAVGVEKLNNDHWRLVKLYHKLGAIYRLTNELPKARQSLTKGQELISYLPEAKINYITPVYQGEFAEVFNDNQQPKKAIEIYKQMISKAEKNKNLKRISIYNNNCGLAYERLGDLGKALYHFEEAMNAKLEYSGEYHARMAAAFTNLSRIHAKLRDYDKAKIYFDKNEKLLLEVLGPGNIRLADNAHSEGYMEMEAGNLEVALEKFKIAETIRQNNLGKSDLKTSDATQMIGRTYFLLGDVQKALLYLEKSKIDRLAYGLAQDYELCNTYCYLYEAYFEIDEIEKAEEYLDLAFSSIGYNHEQPDFFEKMAIPTALIKPLEQKINLLASQKDTEGGDIEKYIEISESLIRYLRYTYDDVASRKILAIDAQSLYNSIVNYYFQAYKMSGNQRFIELAFAVIEKSNNTFLYERIASKIDKSIPESLIEEKNAIVSSINLYQSKVADLKVDSINNNGQLNELYESLTSKKKILYTLINNIKSDYPAYYEKVYNFPITTIDKVQSSLDDNEVLVMYMLGDYTTFSIVIDDGNVSFNKLKDSEKIKASVYNFTSTLVNKNANIYASNAGKFLYENLIAECQLQDYQNINIVANQFLSLLPFEAIPQPDSERPLIMDHNITYQYSATLKDMDVERVVSDEILLMAPVFESESGELTSRHFAEVMRSGESMYIPESKSEVENIAALFKAFPYLEAQATEENFKKEAYNKRILHLATHGTVNENNPGLSTLHFYNADSSATEDGYLTADEIVNMKLNADLVTLSACNTGIGKIQIGEGVASLGRAFAYAGCPNQLISLWSVNDKSTTDLMTRYYTYLKDGKSKSDALRAAKLDYISQAPTIFKHPYYWAGFVYYGDNEVLASPRLFPPMTFMFFGIGILGLLGFLFFKKKKIR